MRFNTSLHARAGLLSSAALALVLLATPAIAGPAGNWERLSPPSQTGGAAVFAAAHQLIYVFGGDGTSILHAVPVNGPPAEWVNVKTTGTAPTARFGHALLYDASHDRLLVFGGQDYYGNYFNDIWQLTLGGTPTWSQITAVGSVPQARSGFGACFDDSRSILVVFGGTDHLGSLLPNHLFQIDLGQPSPGWTDWPAGGSGPSARSGLTLSDDTAQDGLVAFGGNDGSADLSDAWTMSYGSHAWTAIAATGDVPPPTANHLGTFDADDSLLFVWGGTGGDDNVRTLSPASGAWTIQPNTNWQAGPLGHTHPVGAWVDGAGNFKVLDGDGSNQLFDFFYFPPAGSYWQDWQDPGVAGELRYGCSFVYDRADGMAFLSSGSDMYQHPINTTWSYSLAGQKGWFDTGFTNIAGNWTPALTQHVAVWDQQRRRMILFGGQNASYALKNDVYAMQDTTWGYYYWTQLSPAGTPPTPRMGAAAIYDPVGNRMLVFGGLDPSGYYRGDLYQLALAGTPTWSHLTPAGGPTGRYGHSAIYDEPHHRMIVFGGSDSLSGAYDNDVWALNLPAATWTHLAPTGTPPPGRFQHTAVFDSRRDRMLVFGGQVASGSATDTWELNLAIATPAWTKLASTASATGMPYTRYLHAAVYDSTGDRMMVYGGLAPPLGIFGNPWAQKDLWSLQFDFTGQVAGVDPVAPRLAMRVGAPSPNPARAATRLAFELPAPAHVRAGIYDLAGRRIVSLEDGQLPAGRHEIAWDGRDSGGRAAVAGLYFYRVELDGQAFSRKVILAY